MNTAYDKIPSPTNDFLRLERVKNVVKEYIEDGYSDPGRSMSAVIDAIGYWDDPNRPKILDESHHFKTKLSDTFELDLTLDDAKLQGNFTITTAADLEKIIGVLQAYHKVFEIKSDKLICPHNWVTFAQLGMDVGNEKSSVIEKCKKCGEIREAWT